MNNANAVIEKCIVERGLPFRTVTATTHLHMDAELDSIDRIELLAHLPELGLSEEELLRAEFVGDITGTRGEPDPAGVHTVPTWLDAVAHAHRGEIGAFATALEQLGVGSGSTVTIEQGDDVAILGALSMGAILSPRGDYSFTALNHRRGRMIRLRGPGGKRRAVVGDPAPESSLRTRHPMVAVLIAASSPAIETRAGRIVTQRELVAELRAPREESDPFLAEILAVLRGTTPLLTSSYMSPLPPAKQRIRKTLAAVRTVALTVAGVGRVVTEGLKKPLPVRRAISNRGAQRILARLGVSAELQGELPEGPHLLVANHDSYLDAVVLYALLPPRYTFIAKEEFTHARIMHWLLKSLGNELISRFDRHRALQQLGVVPVGTPLVFFPEGTFDRAPRRRREKRGAEWLASRWNVPLVRLSIEGTRTVLPPGSWCIEPGRVVVKVETIKGL